MTQPYPYERNDHAVIMRVGTIAAVVGNTLTVNVPGGQIPNVLQLAAFNTTIGAAVVVLLDGDNAYAIAPTGAPAPPSTAPTAGTKVFHAVQTVAQSVAPSTYAPITWNTVEDPFGSWTSGAAAQFKPKYAGNYLLTGAVGYAASTATYADDDDTRAAVWRKNGALVAQANVANPLTIALAVVARPWLVSLNGTTDYVELAAWHDAAAALNTNVAAGYASSISIVYAGP